MKLVSIGIDPDDVGVFYLLPTTFPSSYPICDWGATRSSAPAWLVPDSTRCTDHYGAETIPLCQREYNFTDYFIVWL